MGVVNMALTLASLKWPVAIAVALLTPAATVSFWQILCAGWTANFWISPFTIGLVGMFVFMCLFHRRRFVQFWATFEHEFTHALFAWLTLVRVHDFWTSDGGGSSSQQRAVGMVRLGGSNWLISVAPYFFPTASALLLVATWLLAEVQTVAASILLGCTTAWCMVSTWHETHVGQQDLKEVGFAFSVLFLPGANIFCYGLLMANEIGGPSRAFDFALSIPRTTLAWFE